MSQGLNTIKSTHQVLSITTTKYIPTKLSTIKIMFRERNIIETISLGPSNTFWTFLNREGEGLFVEDYIKCD